MNVRPLAVLPMLFALAACGGERRSSSATGPDEVRPTPIVVALGDSLTAGPGVAADATYPAVLQDRIRAEGYPHRVINAGVSGDTSADALRRLDAALVENTAVLIVALGANDGLRGVPVAEMKRNLSEIIRRAKSDEIRVLLCGMETPPTRGWDYTVAFHRAFPELAAEYEVPLVPFLLTGVVGNPDLNLGDRIHPNAAGARRIAETIWPYLEPLLQEERVERSRSTYTSISSAFIRVHPHVTFVTAIRAHRGLRRDGLRVDPRAAVAFAAAAGV